MLNNEPGAAKTERGTVMRLGKKTEATGWIWTPW